MAIIRGRLVTGPDMVSYFIRLKTTGKYSHIEFLLDDETTLGSRSSGGVKERPLDSFPTVWNFEIDVTQGQHDKTFAFAFAQKGKSYDYTAIVGIELDRDWREDNSWYCAELFMAALEAGGVIDRLADAINHVTPEECLLILSSMFNVRQV